MSDTATVPTHIGIIMDGNRRWAKEQGLSTAEGAQTRISDPEGHRQSRLAAWNKISFGVCFL